MMTRMTFSLTAACAIAVRVTTMSNLLGGGQDYDDRGGWQDERVDVGGDDFVKRQQPQAESDLVGHLGTWVCFEDVNEAEKSVN